MRSGGGVGDGGGGGDGEFCGKGGGVEWVLMMW